MRMHSKKLYNLGRFTLLMAIVLFSSLVPSYTSRPTPLRIKGETMDHKGHVHVENDGDLVVEIRSSGVAGSGYKPVSYGKEIIVSLARQWMYIYQDGIEIYNTPVTSGRPELRTPTGTYHIFVKLRNAVFYSPWSPGSPYYYPPLFVNYALGWRAGGFFLHDSPRRSAYGPGTNTWHRDPIYGWQTGTHGCVTMPLSAMAWLYSWATIGSTVQVYP